MKDCTKIVEFVITDQARVAELWKVYGDAFRASDDIEIQSVYTEQSFSEMMQDQEITKFIVQHPSKGILGFAVGTNVLEKATVAYVNPETLTRRFPDLVSQHRLWYITGLMVTPEAQALGIGSLVIEAIAEFAVSRKASFAFDYAYDEVRKDQFAQYVVNKTVKSIRARSLPMKGATHIPLGGQHYCVVRLDFDD